MLAICSTTPSTGVSAASSPASRASSTALRTSDSSLLSVLRITCRMSGVSASASIEKRDNRPHGRPPLPSGLNCR
jgi:hypothetical protein